MSCSPELRTREGSYAVAHKLLHKTAMRLRAARLWAPHMTLSIRYIVPKGNRNLETLFRHSPNPIGRKACRLLSARTIRPSSKL